MFSQRLVEIIDQKGLTRYKISKDTKITEATLSNYCNGKVNPSPSIVKQLADYLQVDFDWLFSGEISDSQQSQSDVVSESGTKYRARKKKFSKNDTKSIIAYFEEELKTKNDLLKNNEIGIGQRLASIEEKLDLLIKSGKIEKK